jgi:hypothetical protein
MKWSALGGFVVSMLPGILSLVEEQRKPGAMKKEQYQQAIVNIAGPLAAHPRIQDALSKAADALVDVHNIIAEVQAATASPESSPLPESPASGV